MNMPQPKFQIFSVLSFGFAAVVLEALELLIDWAEDSSSESSSESELKSETSGVDRGSREPEVVAKIVPERCHSVEEIESVSSQTTRNKKQILLGKLP